MFEPNSLILVDMDGVLADYDAALEHAWATDATVLNNGWLPLRSPEWPSVIKLPPQLRERWGEEAVRRYRSLLNSGTFYLNLELIDGAAEGLQALEAAGHTVMICTAPSRHVPTCASEKVLWAERTLGPGWGERTIVTRDKTLVRGDYLIDDKADITGLFAPTWKHLVFGAPHNSSTLSWADILEAYSA